MEIRLLCGNGAGPVESSRYSALGASIMSPLKCPISLAPSIGGAVGADLAHQIGMDPDVAAAEAQGHASLNQIIFIDLFGRRQDRPQNQPGSVVELIAHLALAGDDFFGKNCLE